MRDELATKKKRRGRPKTGVLRPIRMHVKLTCDESILLKRASTISGLTSSNILREGGIPFAIRLVEEWEESNREKYEEYDGYDWEHEYFDEEDEEEYDE